MTTPRPNLLAIAQAIEAKAKPGTVRPAAAPAWTIEPKPPVALSTLIEPKAEPMPAMADVVAKPGSVYLAELQTSLAQERADHTATRTQLTNVLASFDKLTADRVTLVDRIATLTRELAEARADRAAEDRTANRVQVATDANAWHFDGPQGEGTADRIKAVGGRWHFHARNVRSRYHAAGYWIVPHGDASTELLRDLQDSGRPISAKPL